MNTVNSLILETIMPPSYHFKMNFHPFLPFAILSFSVTCFSLPFCSFHVHVLLWEELSLFEFKVSCVPWVMTSPYFSLYKFQ